ncbi:unnamed protein product [Trichobilharzia regenti]|nr:unnamed protein product [Trichobilharzia regenti]
MDAEEEETEADAIERLTEDITESFTEASDVFGEIAEQIEELSIPKYEVDSGGKVTWARYRVVKVSIGIYSNKWLTVDSVFS